VDRIFEELVARFRKGEKKGAGVAAPSRVDNQMEGLERRRRFQMTVERKQEARQKFLLGGIVVKAGLSKADRAFLLGGLLELARVAMARRSIGGCAISAKRRSGRLPRMIRTGAQRRWRNDLEGTTASKPVAHLVPIAVTIITVYITGWRWTGLAAGMSGKTEYWFLLRGSRAGPFVRAAIRTVDRLGLAAPPPQAGRRNKPVVLPGRRRPLWPARIWPTCAIR
jgi:hypothetical protein